MRHRITVVVLAFVALSATVGGCGDDGDAADAGRRPPAIPRMRATPPPVDVPDPLEGARRILEACKGTDVDRLRLLTLTSIRDELPNRPPRRRRRKQQRPTPSLCTQIYGEGSWRAEAVEAWDGEVSAARLGNDEARASFHELEGDELAVVQMLLEDGEWRLKDILSPSPQMFLGWGRAYTPPAE